MSQQTSRRTSRGGNPPAATVPVTKNSFFLEDVYSRECVDDAVEFLLENLSLVITKNWLGTIERPLAAEIAMLKMKKIVAWATSEYDGIDAKREEPLEHLRPDDEPIPVSLDPWARGTVPIRKAPVYEVPFAFDSSGSKSGTPSVSSYRSSNRGGSSRSALMAKGQRPSNGSVLSGISALGRSGLKSAPIHEDETGKIIELEEAEDFDNFQVTGSMFDLLQRTKRLKLKNAQTEDEAKDEFDLIQEQLEKAKEDKKGRKVIVDKDNNVIAVKNVNPEALPPLASSPALSIYDGAVDSHKNSKAITDKDKMKQQRKKTGIRVAGSRRAPRRSKLRLIKFSKVYESTFWPYQANTITDFYFKSIINKN